ncbi:MAG TPA: TIM44-like domain-containing protein [Pyrinomonadaceae bacterium]|nr:TIM44-like domain-containing protein [Pyrinomonadaceae bacterium]
MPKIRTAVVGLACWRVLLSVSGVCLFVVLLAVDALARVGGGQSYGGKGGGGDGDGAAGAIIWIVFQLFRVLLYLTIEYPLVGIPLDIIVIGGVIYFFWRRSRISQPPQIFSTATRTSTTGEHAFVPHSDGFVREFAQLQKFDPNFSEIVFTDFSYALFGKAHEARGRGAQALDLLSPYISQSARSSLLERNGPGLKEVTGIIVGALNVLDVRGLDTPVVQISLLFEANYTEVLQNTNAAKTFYVRERWELERKRDVLSPAPAQATALHCPRCGAPLQRDNLGACAFCGTKIDSGEFQWYVQRITLLEREDRGPLLTSDVPEVGTELPTVVEPGFEQRRLEFEKNHPEFSWSQFQARAALIFNELQAAWSTLDWERARPHETDSIFQMHQYWIDAYRRQGLRNVLDRFAIHSMQPVKIKEDAFYNAITLRIAARGFDYTIDGSGRVVSGSQTVPRFWSEYWTFIRNRQAKPQAARADLNCPNCGALLKVNATGVCAFCGGKITSGEFDWVLSRIEQDESYAG